MRLLHVMAGGRVGGAERFFTDLAAALATRGVEQHAVTRAFPERLDRLNAAGCAVTRARLGGPLDLISGSNARKAAKAFRPDAVLAWMSRAARFAPPGPWPVIGRLGGYYDLKYYRRCDHLVCNTPDLVRHCIEGGWAPDRVTYIPNFSPAASGGPASRAGLDTPERATVMLVLARLVPSKGVDVAIDALSRLPPSVYLWVAGEGPEQKALAQLARDRNVTGRVRFLGWREDRDALIKAATVCVVCSREEPFGNVIVNSWSNGTPVIAAACAGPNYLIRDRDNGLIVPRDAPDALAGAVSELMSNPGFARKLADSGCHDASGTFSENTVCSSYITLFERLAAAR